MVPLAAPRGPVAPRRSLKFRTFFQNFPRFTVFAPRMKTASSCIVLTVVSLLATVGLAQQPNREARLERLLERFPESDANGDGELTPREVRTFIRERRKNRGGRGDRPRGGAQPTHADVAYGDHEKQRFDIWLPDTDEPAPLCIYIHGGGFRAGDKQQVPRGAPQTYLSEGVAFASMNYRLTEGGAHPYPAPMHDAARGLQLIRSRAEEWNLDPERVVCFGGSAGAGISLWLAFHEDLADPGADDSVARESTRILAAGSFNGQSTYDIRTFRDWFDEPDLRPEQGLIDLYAVEDEMDWESERVRQLMEEASPIHHLTGDDPPVYMRHLRGDLPVDATTPAMVWVHHVRLGLELREAMSDLGVECRVASPDHPEDEYGGLAEFLIEKVKGGGE